MALAREHLTGYRASRELAWVVFPARQEGSSALEVLYAPHLGVYRVVARDTRPGALDPAIPLGEFDTAEGAAACVASALLPVPAEVPEPH